mgnify:CR=1 FL=1
MTCQMGASTQVRMRSVSFSLFKSYNKALTYLTDCIKKLPSMPSVKQAKIEMLIRQPAAAVFQAFIDPSITARFWFTKSSGVVATAAQLTWTWEMYNLDVPVQVIEVQPYFKILLKWGDGVHRSTVRWDFKVLGDAMTYVTISNYDFQGSDEEVTAKIIDSTEGFTMVLAGLKAWLEHGIALNLIGDKFPEELRNK